MNKHGIGTALNERGESLIDATYRILGSPARHRPGSGFGATTMRWLRRALEASGTWKQNSSEASDAVRSKPRRGHEAREPTLMPGVSGPRSFRV